MPSNNVIRSTAGKRVGFWLLFAVLWNAVSWPVAILIVPQELKKGNHAALVALIFPAVGLCLLVAAIRAIMQWWRFRRSELRLETTPLVVGGRITGTLSIPRQLQLNDPMMMTLTCTKTLVTGHGKHRHVHTSILWQDTRTYAQNQIESRGGGSLLPVDMVVPFSCQETNEGQRIAWLLQVQADIPGVDLDLDFRLQLRRTDASDSAITEETVAAARLEAAGGTLQPLSKAAGLRLASKGDKGLQIMVPPSVFRYLGSFMFLVVLLGVVGTITYFVARAEDKRWIAAVLLFFDVLLVWGILDCLFKKVRIRLTPNGLERHWRLLLFASTRNYPLSAIQGFESKNAGAASDSSGHVGVAYYRVSAECRVGNGTKHVPIVKMLKGKEDTERLLAILNDQLTRLNPQQTGVESGE